MATQYFALKCKNIYTKPQEGEGEDKRPRLQLETRERCLREEENV